MDTAIVLSGGGGGDVPSPSALELIQIDLVAARDALVAGIDEPPFEEEE
ncbi:hypothetical protein V7087_04445 [Neobacillus niacini]